MRSGRIARFFIDTALRKRLVDGYIISISLKPLQRALGYELDLSKSLQAEEDTQ